MGVTGAGKSTFIHHVTGQKVGVGHGLASHTIGVKNGKAKLKILEAKAELKKKIQQLQIAQEEMIQESKETLANELASQRKAFEERLAEASEAQETLKISFEGLVERKEAEYKKLLAVAITEQQQLTAALKGKAAEFERARLEQLEDEESFQEAQAEFTSEVQSLRQKLKDQEDMMEQQKLKV
ncbi:hypothetical protein ACHAPD_004599 [Fusarium lateritium]